MAPRVHQGLSRKRHIIHSYLTDWKLSQNEGATAEMAVIQLISCTKAVHTGQDVI